MFYLASRLDPLPNVTIDAAMRGLPVICFEGASGMAEILKGNPTASNTVVPHLDATPPRDGSSELGERQRITQARRQGDACVWLGELSTWTTTFANRQDWQSGRHAMQQRVADFETSGQRFVVRSRDLFARTPRPTRGRWRSRAYLACWSAARTAPHQLDYLDLRRPCAGLQPSDLRTPSCGNPSG